MSLTHPDNVHVRSSTCDGEHEPYDLGVVGVLVWGQTMALNQRGQVGNIQDEQMILQMILQNIQLLR